MKDWTDERTTQLFKLRDLLREVRHINHGSNAVERIQHCERLADDLVSCDQAKPEKSFYGFLNDLCIRDREAK